VNQHINMLTAIHPKLPMRSKEATRAYYVNQLGFAQVGAEDYEGYLMVEKEGVQIHFFQYTELAPEGNYSGVYIRTNAIDALYQSLLNRGVAIHPNGPLEEKPWGQKEFSLLDPDHNLLTFGQEMREK
jgi:catechol 2,3-dioxygenase-like lactoylglutathione lyase family enzyme